MQYVFNVTAASGGISARKARQPNRQDEGSRERGTGRGAQCDTGWGDLSCVDDRQWCANATGVGGICHAWMTGSGAQMPQVLGESVMRGVVVETRE